MFVISDFSCVQLFATPWIIASQAPLSVEFPRQEYWSGLPFPPPRDLPDPGIEPMSPALGDGFFTAEPLLDVEMLIVRRFKKKKNPLNIFQISKNQDFTHLFYITLKCYFLLIF